MHERKTRLKFVVLALAGALAFWATLSAGQPSAAPIWPQRPVHVIVTVGPGIAADIAARVFSARLSERWKQPVVIENRPGGEGIIGAQAFIGLHDDHAMLFSFAGPASVLPLTHAKLPFDPIRDLVPIALATDTFATVSVPTSLNVRSLAELVALARANPGKLNYASGVGAFPILVAGFARNAGIEIVPVAYRELNPAIQDLVTGRIQIGVAVMSPFLPLVQAGKLRFLAVTNKQRAPVLPDVPTTAEAGFPDFFYEGLTGFFGSREMSSETRDRIAADVRSVAAEPEVAKRMLAIGQIARGGTPAEFATGIAEQRASIASVMQRLGLKATQ